MRADGSRRTKYVDEVLLRVRDDDNSLDRVVLVGEDVGPDGAAELADALRSNTTVLEVWLQRCRIGDGGTEAICLALRGKEDGEDDDNGSNAMVGKKSIYGWIVARFWMTKIPDKRMMMPRLNARVRKLILSHNDIGDEGAKYLAGALRRGCALTDLYLSHNGIGPDGIDHLADSLRCNDVLKGLHLKGNTVRDEGTRGLAVALVHNCTLEHLYLGRTHIGDDGVAALACALQINTRIKTLNLQSNEIGERGARLLADAAQNLRGFQIREEEPRRFAAALFGTSALFPLGIAEVMAVRRNLWSPICDRGEIWLDTGLERIWLDQEDIAGDGVPEVVDREGQPEILKAIYMAGMRWAAKDESPSLPDHIVAVLWETMNLTAGVSGLYDVVRERPHLFHLPPNKREMI